MKDNLVQKIEAILFYLAEPVEVNFLTKTLEVNKKDILAGVEELAEILKTRGLRLTVHDEEVTLVTAPEFAKTIEKIIKEERERDLGRAGIETLAIVAYKGPVSKKEIEYIRGVNSQWALRSLLLRGLVEKKAAKGDERVVVYTVTSDALRHLGLGKISDLPEYAETQKQLEVAEETEEITDESKEDGE
jgi:segregation and condensation protein B